MFPRAIHAVGLAVLFVFIVPLRGEVLTSPHSLADHDTTASGGGLLPAPVFSHAPGFYGQSFYLGITNPDDDAVICFTLPPGVYTLLVQSGQITATAKVITGI